MQSWLYVNFQEWQDSSQVTAVNDDDQSRHEVRTDLLGSILSLLSYL